MADQPWSEETETVPVVGSGPKLTSSRSKVRSSPGSADSDWLAGQTAGNVEEFEAALAGEEVLRRLVDRERVTTLERLAAGRSDFFGDSYDCLLYTSDAADDYLTV